MDHKCPKCKKLFHGQKEIQDKVGFRTINKITYFQSYCKRCRSLERQEKKLSRII